MVRKGCPTLPRVGYLGSTYCLFTTAIYRDRLLKMILIVRILLVMTMVMAMTVRGRVGDYLSPPLPTKMPGDQSAQQLTTTIVTQNETMTKMTNFLPL